MSTKTWLYFLASILTLLFIVTTIILLPALIAAGSFDRTIIFVQTMATVAAVVIAIVSIAMSIHKAEIAVNLGQKREENGMVWQEIRIVNKGDVAGNMAHAFVEIKTDTSDNISFVGATGLTFTETEGSVPKRYRYTNPQRPIIIYPGKDVWSNLGFLVIPKTIPDKVLKLTLTVRVIGSQGVTYEDIDVSVS